ncbi:serine O-acetyltransferase [Pseudomonas spirodelae]|uniref:Serine acetyltransferase n=1 Tax=Pseudomonas spirodelae TaxID=3101751 RepID=A0ABU5P4Y6_9PSED|nr:serine acetyltransferase [Pseudomonas sp. T5W1]MEA1604722.1 serine acetyltransferase [Pseudomonas sp. T5W1]
MVESSDIRPESDVLLGTRNCNPPGIGFMALIKEDFITHERDLFSQGFWALAVQRFGNWRMGIGNRLLRMPLSLLYKILEKLVEWLCGISLKYTVVVGRRVRIWHHGGMVLGALAIGDDVHIRQNTTFGVKHRGDPRWLKPVIGNRCDIGTGAVIVGGIEIGDDSFVGANAVLAQSVPANSVVLAVKPQITMKSQ